MIKPHRTKHLMTVGFVMGVLAIISMIVNISTLTMLHDQKIIKESVVEYKQVVLATDSQRIQLFIDELLTPKSAACFRAILNRESHMNPLAKNPYSSASGVGQLLSSTYQNLGMRKSSDPLAQVVASLAYISRKFGGASSTCNAWHVWQKQGSY